MEDIINDPKHYGGKDNPLEVIKILDHYNLGFSLGNTIKYILRAGKKDPDKYLEDLKKAQYYLSHEITKRESEKKEKRSALSMKISKETERLMQAQEEKKGFAKKHPIKMPPGWSTFDEMLKVKNNKPHKLKNKK